MGWLLASVATKVSAATMANTVRAPLPCKCPEVAEPFASGTVETSAARRQLNSRRRVVTFSNRLRMDISDLPLFPLELVLYPGEATSLHIFEERYKLMVRDCVREKRPFGIVLFEEGKMAEVGCEAQIREVLRRYPDGRMDIAVVGQRRFRIEQVIDQKAYMQCEATLLNEPDEQVDSDSVERLITQHMKLLEVAGHEVRPTVYQDVDQLSFFIGRNAGLSLGQRQELLERESENARVRFLVGFLEDFIPQVQQMEETRVKIRSNGHFKDFPEGEEGVD